MYSVWENFRYWGSILIAIVLFRAITIYLGLGYYIPLLDDLINQIQAIVAGALRSLPH